MNVRNGTGGSSSNASTRPFAVALSVELEFHNRDETSGERVSSYCVETKLEADAELIRTACFWPSTCSTSRRRRAPPLAGGQEIDACVSSALAFQIVPNVVVGVDLWYLRHYQRRGVQLVDRRRRLSGPNGLLEDRHQGAHERRLEADRRPRDRRVSAALDLTDFPRQRATLLIEF